MPRSARGSASFVCGLLFSSSLLVPARALADWGVENWGTMVWGQSATVGVPALPAWGVAALTALIASVSYGYFRHRARSR